MTNILDLVSKFLGVALMVGPSILTRMSQEADAQRDFYGDVGSAVAGADDLVALGEEIEVADAAAEAEIAKRQAESKS